MKGKEQERFMERAVKEALKGIQKGEGGPFGACLVKDGAVIAVACNTVLKSNDPTGHAEVNVIRKAAKKLRTFDLSGAEIYSTTEPCPMCFAAIHWARITTLYYGSSIADVAKRGFNEMPLSNEKMKKLGKSRVRIRKGFLRERCLELLREWDKKKNKRCY